MLQDDGTFLKVTHILIDSGASSCCISREAVRRPGLKVYQGTPTPFSTCHGIICQDKYVHVNIWLSGIQKSVAAFVDQGDASRHFLMGRSSLTIFDMRINFNFSRESETRGTITQNITVYRRERFVLKEDQRGHSIITTYIRVIGLRIRERARERHGREVVQRGKAELRRRRARYGHLLHSDPQLLRSILLTTSRTTSSYCSSQNVDRRSNMTYDSLDDFIADDDEESTVEFFGGDDEEEEETSLSSTGNGHAMRLFVHDRDEKTWKIEVDEQDTVADAKLEMQARSGISASRRRMVFAGKELRDDRALEDYGIDQDGTLHLVVR